MASPSMTYFSERLLALVYTGSFELFATASGEPPT